MSILSKMASPAHLELSYREMLAAAMVAGYAVLAWFAPNTQEIMGYDHHNRTVGEALGGWPQRRSFIYASAALLAFAILGIQQHSEFIYFRF
jgi:hypothetical protein